ncbi:MAG: HemK family protein methyltransferase [Patescibacteria group bacterium]
MLTDPNDDYARGFVPFLKATIYLDSRPLIPRVETEYWVEKVTATLPHNHHIRVLDLFAGSGAIGVAVLKHLPNTHVTFGELEERHLATIKKNIRENDIETERTQVVQTDVWQHIQGTFDYALANPPYVSRERGTAETSTEVEPNEALYAPDDGFFYIEKFIQGLPQHLTPTGVAYVEHEPFHVKRISEVATKHGFVAETHTDQYGMARFTALRYAVPLRF